MNHTFHIFDLPIVALLLFAMVAPAAFARRVAPQGIPNQLTPRIRIVAIAATILFLASRLLVFPYLEQRLFGDQPFLRNGPRNTVPETAEQKAAGQPARRYEAQ